MRSDYAFGELLRLFRVREDLSQSNLANLIGVHRNTITNWENGNSRPDTREIVLTLAEKLSLSNQETDRLLFTAQYPLEYDTPLPRQPGATTLSFEMFMRELRLKREFIPLKDKGLSSETGKLLQGFNFVGAKWSDVFGFVVAVVKADGLRQDDIAQICEAAFELNDRLYWRPSELGIPRLAWLFAFTLGGVVCFVFENEWSEALMNEIGDQRRKTPVYDPGALSLKPAIQRRATSFAWTVNLKSGQLFRHLGKQPDKLSYHTRRMQKELANLETIIDAILQDDQFQD